MPSVVFYSPVTDFITRLKDIKKKKESETMIGKIHPVSLQRLGGLVTGNESERKQE